MGAVSVTMAIILISQVVSAKVNFLHVYIYK
jgi:hypothetical protein